MGGSVYSNFLKMVTIRFFPCSSILKTEFVVSLSAVEPRSSSQQLQCHCGRPEGLIFLNIPATYCSSLVVGPERCETHTIYLGEPAE